MDAFYCPVCGSQSFVELTPHAGVWCETCNSKFEVGGTCDGLRKILVSCDPKEAWRSDKYPDIAKVYWTVIWEADKKISWLARTKDKKLKTVRLENGKPTMYD